MNNYVILVDKSDKEIGLLDKMEAHIKGELHRAFSIFVFNSDKKLLIHKRASSKYHSGGLWTNTCCSHPQPGEEILISAHRRLIEEMGFDCELKKIFSFTYKGHLDKGLIENEIDHVFIGEFNGQPEPNPEEIEDYIWIAPTEVINDIKQNPNKYSYWFKIAIRKVMKYIDNIEKTNQKTAKYNIAFPFPFPGRGRG
ncbi:MAG TPA: isopentenyl-diphosphate Delta-isomerase [Pseudobacteroides sp.]|nr:isopentenyl-diphosphate Delta-isomerase [Pseudobacteroides sp.]